MVVFGVKALTKFDEGLGCCLGCERRLGGRRDFMRRGRREVVAVGKVKRARRRRRRLGNRIIIAEKEGDVDVMREGRP